ncbi:MAG: DNA-3-methyladenine glycosylase 2 family protein [Clostridia bacterium]|nr:DNA-3-methyladenine glycosylase 2 family protein [Clostridia bacterium]
MRICEKNNDLILYDMSSFDLFHTFDCGQCFRWNYDEDGFSGVAQGRYLHICQKDGKIIFKDTSLDTFNRIWKHYFDLERDYETVKAELSKDAVLKNAISFGGGIRILNQDAFECLISFIISASNNIPRIKKIIELLCANFGEEFVKGGRIYHKFPTAETLSALSLEDLSVIKAGFRDKYILAAAKAVKNGQIDLASLKNASFDYAKSQLLRLSGVGEKVASCILLFGLEKHEGFPVDVWVKRIMEYCYFDKEQTKETISEFANNKFGDLGGFAQQYLFYWARENKIGIE